MRPKQILRELLKSLDRRYWDEVETHANEMLEAMKQHAPPRMVGPASLGPGWHHAVAAFVCYAALSKVHEARKRRQRRKLKSG